MKRVFFIGSILMLSLCSTKDPEVQEIHYNLRNPIATIMLEAELVEISGLAFYQNQLYAVHDEKSKCYQLDKDSGQIAASIELDKTRDYEGLTFRGDTCYITTSKGKIITLNMITKEIDKTKSHLLEDYDVEGIAWYAPLNSFLLACKDYGKDRDKYKGNRLVFEYDPISQTVGSDPILLLNKKALNQFMHTKYGTTKDREFKPSGMAFHPRTGDLYVLSSRSRAVMVFAPGFRLKDIMLLRQNVVQPEGIAFDEDLTLFIASEGGGFGPAKLFKFTPVIH